MSRYQNAIHWFRRDLRLSDNTALSRATEESVNVFPVYIASDWKGEHRWTGPGRQAFLCGCLESLAKNVEHAGGSLLFRRGEAVEELERLIDSCKAEVVYLNRDPDPHGREVEKRVKALCRERGVGYIDCQDHVLHDPGEVLTGEGNPYKVYTPFSKTWFSLEKPSCGKMVRSFATPGSVKLGSPPSLADWGLKEPAKLFREAGEKAARNRLKVAISSIIGRYEEMRNDPAADATSHLGADLRYGTLSVREVFHRAEKARLASRSESIRRSIYAFQKQLAWREFFMAILHHFPEVLETDFNPSWRGLPWDDPGEDEKFFRWQEGKTGFPIVDAGMRQLRETGYMHNRVRMITAMFLTKDLHVHWKEGERHFMRYLLDGEIANNNGGWQWSAGTGADAAPYFRIQNPWTQTARYDAKGEYIKTWVPELAKVDAKRFQSPPDPGERLCSDYIEPIVDHRAEREETLRRFKAHA